MFFKKPFESIFYWIMAKKNPLYEVIWIMLCLSFVNVNQMGIIVKIVLMFSYINKRKF